MKFLRQLFLALAGLIQFILYSALFFVLMLGAGYWVASKYFGGEEAVAPDLRDKEVTAALEELRPLKVSLQLERMQPHVQVRAGHVISQNPRAGSRVKTGSPIRVVVSEGQPLTTVPDLRGRNKIEAGIRLRKLGLDVGSNAVIPRDQVPPGSVLMTDPPPGAGVPNSTKINLLLAAGEGTVLARMPNLIGLDREEAGEILSAYGLEIGGAQERDGDGVPVGQIHGQVPPPDAPISPGQRITVVIQPARAEVPALPSDMLGREEQPVPEPGEDARAPRVDLPFLGR